MTGGWLDPWDLASIPVPVWIEPARFSDVSASVFPAGSRPARCAGCVDLIGLEDLPQAVESMDNERIKMKEYVVGRYIV